MQAFLEPSDFSDHLSEGGHHSDHRSDRFSDHRSDRFSDHLSETQRGRPIVTSFDLPPKSQVDLSQAQTMDAGLLQTFLQRDADADARERALMKRVAELERENAQLDAALQLERDRVDMMAGNQAATRAVLSETPSETLKSRLRATKKRNVELMVQVRDLKLALADKEKELATSAALIASMDLHGMSQRANIAMLETALRHPGTRPPSPPQVQPQRPSSPSRSIRAPPARTPPPQEPAEAQVPTEAQVLEIKLEQEVAHKATLLDLQSAYEHLLSRAKKKIQKVEADKAEVVSKLSTRQAQLETELLTKRQLSSQLDLSRRAIRDLKTTLHRLLDQMEIKINQSLNVQSLTHAGQGTTRRT